LAAQCCHFTANIRARLRIGFRRSRLARLIATPACSRGRDQSRFLVPQFMQSWRLPSLCLVLNKGAVMSMCVRGNGFSALVLISAMAIFGSALLPAGQAQAADADAPLFSTNASMAANLKNLAGKKVTVYLKGGTPLTGIVKATGDHLVHLEKLDGKDFFDALVLIDQIGAIDTRARTPGR
jgi:hypothetical protein